MPDLFPPSFLAAINGLSVHIRRAAPRALHGAHQSPRAGASLEFRDYQPYAAGDDLRRVDWNIFQRTRHLFLRRYEHPTSVPIHILLDSSRSMLLESPSRYATGARLAAAVALASLNSQNVAAVTVLDNGRTAQTRRIAGRAQFTQLLAELSDPQPRGDSSVSSIHHVLRRRGADSAGAIAVVISDFFDGNGVESILDSLRRVPHRLVLLRVTQPWDADPETRHADGAADLIDCETGQRQTVSPSRQVYARYRDAYTAFFGAIDAFANTRGALSAAFDASAETVPQLQRIFPAGILTL